MAEEIAAVGWMAAMTVGLGGSLLLAAGAVGAGIGIACAVGDCPFRARSEDITPMLLQINSANLTGNDVAKLAGLAIDSIDIGQGRASFRSDVFDGVNGTLTINNAKKRDMSRKGLVSGDISFPIPGLEREVEGTWVAVDPTVADDKTKKAFNNVHKGVTSAHSQKEAEKKGLESMVYDLLVTADGFVDGPEVDAWFHKVLTEGIHV